MMGLKTLAEIRAELRRDLEAMGPNPIERIEKLATEGGKKPLSEGSKEILESLDRVLRNAEQARPVRKRKKAKAKS